LFLFEEYSSAGTKEPVSRHSFSSKKTRLLPEVYCRHMCADLTYKTAILTTNYQFRLMPLSLETPQLFFFISSFLSLSFPLYLQGEQLRDPVVTVKARNDSFRDFPGFCFVMLANSI
jgi:hypothetical protein